MKTRVCFRLTWNLSQTDPDVESVQPKNRSGRYDFFHFRSILIRLSLFNLTEQEPRMILDQGMYAEVHQGRVLGSHGFSPCEDDDDSLTLKSSPVEKVKGLARLDPY